MKNILKILALGVMLITFTSTVNAEMRFGASLAYTQIDADGTETEGGEKNNGSADNNVIIPSLFVEFGNDKFALGLDYIPMKADVSDSTKKRTDTETSVTGTTTTTSTSRVQSVNAELKDHITIYANMHLNEKLYLKAGYAQVSLETSDSLATGSKYGNVDINAGVFGLGVTDGNSRLEVVYTDYEDISLTSSVARTGVSTNNKISADLDTLALKYSYAF